MRHVVLDLRGLTFMDVVGLRELLRQNEYARANRHNLAVVRGTVAIQRVLELTDVEGQLVIVDDPDDLVPPSAPTDGAAPRLEAASLEITLTRASGRVTLTLVGELDLATTPRLEKYLTTVAATQQQLIVIDLRQLTFLDSTGVAALVAADRHARRDGRGLAIVKGPPQVQRVLDDLRLDRGAGARGRAAGGQRRRSVRLRHTRGTGAEREYCRWRADPAGQAFSPRARSNRSATAPRRGA